MCGIVGVVTEHQNGFSQTESNVFKDLLMMDTVRGLDSTGVMSVDYYGNLHVLKEASVGPQFIKHEKYKDFQHGLYSRGKIAFGHNRAATRGTINDKNAHPFLVGTEADKDKICLLQNGTYRGDHKKHKDVEVDTEAIAHVLAEEDNIEKALKKINAAYALAWYNIKNKQFHIIRNTERPLWIAYSKDGFTTVYASEPGFIYAAAARHGMELKGKAYQIQDKYLITYTIKDQKELGVEYKENCDIDYVYEYQHNRGFLPASGNILEDDDGDLETFLGRQYGAPVTIPKPVNVHSIQERRLNAGLLDISIRDYCQRGEFNKEHFESREGGYEYIKEYGSPSVNKKEMLVEFTDWKPANMHPKCSVWHLYGSPVFPDPNNKFKKLLIVYTKFDITEETLVNWLAQNQTFLTKPTHFAANSACDDSMKYGIIPVLHVSDLQPIPVLTSEVHQDHVH